MRERESSDYCNPSSDIHEHSHVEKRIRHTETCVDIGSEIDIPLHFHDDVSVHTPNSIVNSLLYAQFELDVIPERDKVDEMFQFDIESESDAEDNSLACIMAAVADSIVTPAITNAIDGTNECVVAPDVHQVVGIEKPNVSRADQLLICLSALCTDANVPLYLVDDIIEIILDETDRGLILNSSQFSKRRSFFPRLSTIFPSPKPQSLHIRIKGNYKVDQPGLRDSVSIVCYDFLEQVNDLLNDETLFGNISNFEGTIDLC